MTKKDSGRPEGTRKIQEVSYQALKDFLKVVEVKDIGIDNLDVLLRNFAKWIHVPEAMVETDQEVQCVQKDKMEICAMPHCFTQVWALWRVPWFSISLDFFSWGCTHGLGSKSAPPDTDSNLIPVAMSTDLNIGLL